MARKSLESFIKWLDVYNPTRSYLLSLFKLDKAMVRGVGHSLWDGSGTEYLDFLSQYGAVSLGHNHPELCDAVRDCLFAQCANMVQPLPSPAAQDLAKQLVRIAPRDLAHCIFTNSGAEAVEAGIKLARAKTGKRIILSTVNGFHGKTLGALSATGRRKYQSPFGAPVPDFEYVPFGDLDALEARLKSKADRMAAFIVEPIQGEGGVRLPPQGYLASAIALCKQHNVLFILDEIQTGLGRTGEMFALPKGTGSPDILLLAKALGGGLFPIGACISTQKAWDHEFGFLHSSTFASNSLGCRIGLKVIEILERSDYSILKHVASNGEYLLGRLSALKDRFPSVIKEVRGKGFLVGVEFQPFTGDDSYTMSYFSNGDYLIALFSSYLLNVHRILTAPVFNDSHVLRLEPPFTVGRVEIDRVIQALEILCEAIERKDYYEILRFLIDCAETSSAVRRFQAPYPPNPTPQKRTAPEEKGRFAFLIHYTSDSDFFQTDPSFRQFAPDEFERWKKYIEDSAEPQPLYHLEEICSMNGAIAEGWLIGIPMLASSMVKRGRQKMIPIMRDALEIAKEKGARILGLGGFTSIVSRGGESLLGHGIAVTSGNTLTSLMAVGGITDVVTRLGLSLSSLHVAVVGAAGSVGRLTALLLASRVAKLTLVGNPGRTDGEARCLSVQKEITEAIENECSCELRSSTKLETALIEADVIVIATSTTQELVQPWHMKPRAVVCDVARPHNVSHGLVAQRPDILVFEGGLVRLPDAIHFGPNLQGYRPGINLACLAECMLLALEGEYMDHSIGTTCSLAEANHIGKLAKKHGFSIAPPHWLAKELPESAFDRVKSSVSALAVATEPVDTLLVYEG